LQSGNRLAGIQEFAGFDLAVGNILIQDILY
jgi:hypothetical protein